MLNLLGFVLTIAAAATGYFLARRFVVSKLRFVDAVHTMKAPIIAGLIAGVVAFPVVAFLPLLHAGTAIVFGLGVGTGVAAGARDIRKRLGPGQI